MRGNKTIKGGVRRQRVNPIYGNLPLVLHWYCAGIALVGIVLVLHWLVLCWYCIPAMENQFNWRYNIHLYVIAKYAISKKHDHQPTNTSVMIGDGGVDCGLPHVRGELAHVRGKGTSGSCSYSF